MDQDISPPIHVLYRHNKIEPVFYRITFLKKIAECKNIAATYKILCTTKKTLFISLFPRQRNDRAS